MGEASRVGEWPGVEREDPASVFLGTSRRLRGRASGSRAAGARVLEDDDDDVPIEGIIMKVVVMVMLLARRPRTSGRWDGSD